MEFSKEDIKAIENFIIDIDILDSLKSYLNKFNAFETLGIAKMEIRHSNVLGWLLSPNENHGLGDIFIKKFIQSVMASAGEKLSNCNLNIFDISLMDYYDFRVRREWKNIDILIESEKNKLVICIENKVDSRESKHQLRKYYNIVNEEYKEYNKIFIFLTPEGDDASDTENWITTNYSSVVTLIEKSLELKSNNINNEIKSFINQYIEILRRHIVDNDKIAEICREIYYKHQKALDLIFENKPDIYTDIQNIIKKLLEENTSDLIVESINKVYTRFTTQILDEIIDKRGNGWTSSKRILLYELQNKGEKLLLKLIIGPGDEELREKIFSIAENNKDVFKGKFSKLTMQYTQIYSKEILKKNYSENYDIETIEKTIKNEVEKFFKVDMINIDNVIKNNINLFE